MYNYYPRSVPIRAFSLHVHTHSPSSASYYFVSRHVVLPSGIDLPLPVVAIVIVTFGQNVEVACGAEGKMKD